MKKLLILSNLFLLLIITYQGCKPDKYGTTKSCPPCKDYTNLRMHGQISWSFAKTIASNYKNDISKSLVWSNGVKTDSSDSRSIWFSVETLKQFIWNIEEASCRKKCSDSLGVRIYFARYPEASNPIWLNVNLTPVKRYANHHTLFMVPTFWDRRTNTHVDFDAQAQTCRKIFDNTSTKPTIMLFGTGSDAQNHGNLIPPDEESGLAF